MATLTPKQRAFVEEYLIDFNGTRAAERAGYRGNDGVLAAQASRLLKNVKVADRIAEHFKNRAMSADEVLSRLAEQARADHTQYLEKDGTVDLPRLIMDGKAHLVKSTHWDKDGRLVVKFHDTQSALALIGKHHKLFADRMEHTGEGGGDIVLRVVYDEPKSSDGSA
jgi:phage terminase small subunit